MPLEGHWARQQAPLRARERGIVVALLAVVVAGALALLLAAGHDSSATAGCVNATIASTTGGAAVHACGDQARRLCADPAATSEIREACARAGLADPRIEQQRSSATATK